MLRTHNETLGLYLGKRNVLRIADPELIKQVLVKDFHKFINRFNMKTNAKTFDLMLFASTSDDWKRLRALSSPTFTSGKMKKMYHLVNECTDLLVDAIDKIATEKHEIELKKVFANLTMDAICSCAFATKTNTHENDNNPLVRNWYLVLNRTFTDKLRLLLFFTFPFLSKMGMNLFNPEPIKAFDRIIKEIIAQREKETHNVKKPADFLQLMIDSRHKKLETEDENDVKSLDSAESHHINYHKEASLASSSITKQPLTEDELIAQCFIFIIAGFETTATLLSYLFYSLAVNEECQNRLLEEVNANTNEKGDIDYETLAQMPYLDACISEALRLYDPLVHLERTAMEDTKLGDIFVPKEMPIQIPIYAIHHDEKYYPEPFAFNPERFLPENRHKLVQYTYLPFGAGPRNCIGLRFALMEAKLSTVKVLQKFRFTPNSKTTIPVQLKAGSGLLLQCNDLIVKVETR